MWSHGAEGSAASLRQWERENSKSSSYKCHAFETANKKRTGLTIKAAVEEQKKEKLSKQEKQERKDEEEKRSMLIYFRQKGRERYQTKWRWRDFAKILRWLG